MKQIGDVVYRIQYCGKEPLRTRRRVVHHNQIKLCTMPHFDLESPCTQGSSQHNGNVGRVTHNTVSADDLTNEVDMEDLTLGADAAIEPEADVAVEPETDATVGLEADVTVGSETDATIGPEADMSVAQKTMSGSQAETVEHLPENLRVTRSGRLSRMRRKSDYEYY